MSDDKDNKTIYIQNPFILNLQSNIKNQTIIIGAPQDEDAKEDGAAGNDLNNTDDPAAAFVERVKAIMTEAAKNNGKRMTNNARGNTTIYTCNVDDKGFAAVMDKLLEENRAEIEAYLGGANANVAVKIKYVAPFIGHIHSTHRYTPEQMPNTEFKDAFEAFYGNGDTAVNKMTEKYPSDEAKKLHKAVDIIMIQLQK